MHTHPSFVVALVQDVVVAIGKDVGVLAFMALPHLSSPITPIIIAFRVWYVNGFVMTHGILTWDKFARVVVNGRVVAVLAYRFGVPAGVAAFKEIAHLERTERSREEMICRIFGEVLCVGEVIVCSLDCVCLCGG